MGIITGIKGPGEVFTAINILPSSDICLSVRPHACLYKSEQSLKTILLSIFQIYRKKCWLIYILKVFFLHQCVYS